MKTDKGIHVDLISGVSGRKPLDFQTDRAIFVRMPHGQFSVRVVTPLPTNVAVSLDGVELLKTKVQPKQINLLSTDDEGNELRFDLPGESPARPVKDGDRQDADTPKPAASLPKSNGLVLVSLQFAEQPKTKFGPARQAGETETVCFQMNAPGQHERALLANFNRIIPPEGVTQSGCSCCRHGKHGS